jgi:peroxiredoxin
LEFAEQYERMQQGNIAFVAVSSDTVAECRELETRLELPFTLYADPECVAIKQLGVYHENEPKGRHIARPTLYILDAERIIRYRYIGENARDRPETAEIIERALGL